MERERNLTRTRCGGTYALEKSPGLKKRGGPASVKEGEVSEILPGTGYKVLGEGGQDP